MRSGAQSSSNIPTISPQLDHRIGAELDRQRLRSSAAATSRMSRGLGSASARGSAKDSFVAITLTSSSGACLVGRKTRNGCWRGNWG